MQELYVIVGSTKCVCMASHVFALHRDVFINFKAAPVLIVVTHHPISSEASLVIYSPLAVRRRELMR